MVRKSINGSILFLIVAESVQPVPLKLIQAACLCRTRTSDCINAKETRSGKCARGQTPGTSVVKSAFSQEHVVAKQWRSDATSLALDCQIVSSAFWRAGLARRWQKMYSLYMLSQLQSDVREKAVLVLNNYQLVRTGTA